MGQCSWANLKLYASTRAWSFMTIRGHRALMVAGHIVPGVNVLSPRQPSVGPLAPVAGSTTTTFIKNRNQTLEGLRTTYDSPGCTS